MKTILEFSLPDDREELNIHMKAWVMFRALRDFRQELRTRSKADGWTDDQQKLYESYIQTLVDYELAEMV